MSDDDDDDDEDENNRKDRLAFCCSFVVNLLQYPSAKNYQNTMQFDEVIAKIKGAIFCLTVYI